jgi:hypothetical protein
MLPYSRPFGATLTATWDLPRRPPPPPHNCSNPPLCRTLLVWLLASCGDAAATRLRGGCNAAANAAPAQLPRKDGMLLCARTWRDAAAAERCSWGRVAAQEGKREQRWIATRSGQNGCAAVRLGALCEPVYSHGHGAPADLHAVRPLNRIVRVCLSGERHHAESPATHGSGSIVV